MATRVLKAAATITADPTVKSRTFVAPIKGGYQSAQLRASDVQRYRPGTVLSAVAWRGRQIAQTRFVTTPGPPLSAVYTYQTGLLPDSNLPASGQVGIANSTPDYTLLISTTDRAGALSTAFLEALFSARIITFTSGAKVAVYTNTFGDIVKTGSYYRISVSRLDNTFADGDVVTITYA
jgi:hypothetical protein